MFKAIALGALALSSVAMADVELKVLYPRPKMECTIVKGEVTRVLTFGKEKIIKMTQKSQFKIEGIEVTARKAADLSSNRAPEFENESFSMILDGKKIELHSAESPEALALVQLMVQACQL